MVKRRTVWRKKARETEHKDGKMLYIFNKRRWKKKNRFEASTVTVATVGTARMKTIYDGEGFARERMCA